MLRGEVEVAVHSLEAGKSPGVDNIPSELLNNGDEATTVLTALCQKIWETKDTIFCHTFTKESQPQALSELLYHQPDHAQPTQG